MKKNADKSVDELYGEIRNEYFDARANGYRLHTYFLREQEIIISTLGEDLGVVLDIGCGSGLMSIPLLDKARLLLGLDFNEHACLTAKSNSLNTIRGNAFSMPLHNACVNDAYCCQFLNQQSQENTELLLSECWRILIPGGKIILIWRNGEAVIHKVAHRIFGLFDRLKGRPSFPMINHSISKIEQYAHSIGFVTVKKETIFPLLRWHSSNVTSLTSNIIGASYFLVLKRN